jgi:DNA-binding transcriptional MocR family regulator
MSAARVQAHYLENRDVLIGALKRNFGEGGISGEGGGLHLLWRLPVASEPISRNPNLGR